MRANVFVADEVVDYAVFTKDGRLEGRTEHVAIQAAGEIGDDGMVIDFAELKESLLGVVAVVDHRLVPENDKEIHSDVINASPTCPRYYRLCAGAAFVTVPDFNLAWTKPTTQRYLESETWHLLMPMVANTILHDRTKAKCVHVTPSKPCPPYNAVTFTYSHMLPDHVGACKLLHGHEGYVKVTDRRGEARPSAKAIAAELNRKLIAPAAWFINEDKIEVNTSMGEFFAYLPGGTFALPGDMPSTVENIAQVMADRHILPGEKLTLYEGFGKGTIIEKPS